MAKNNKERLNSWLNFLKKADEVFVSVSFKKIDPRIYKIIKIKIIDKKYFMNYFQIMK